MLHTQGSRSSRVLALAQDAMQWKSGGVTGWLKALVTRAHQFWRRGVRLLARCLPTGRRVRRRRTVYDKEFARFQQAFQLTQSQIVLHLHGMSLVKDANEIASQSRWRRRLNVHSRILAQPEVLRQVQWLILVRHLSSGEALTQVFNAQTTVAANLGEADELNVLQRRILENLRYVPEETA
jgi:phosphoenolpyruvate-protein kinase (PTS system EI component)